MCPMWGFGQTQYPSGVFRAYRRVYTGFSVAEPGHTDAVEFDDGKVMLGKMESLNELTWDTIQNEVGQEQLKKIFSGADPWPL